MATDNTYEQVASEGESVDSEQNIIFTTASSQDPRTRAAGRMILHYGELLMDAARQTVGQRVLLEHADRLRRETEKAGQTLEEVFGSIEDIRLSGFSEGGRIREQVERLSLIHISSPRDRTRSRMPSSA